MRYFHLYYLLLPLLFLFLSIPRPTHELQASHTQVLLQLRKYLENPTSLDILESHNGDLCDISPPSPSLSIKCEDNSVSELKIMGDKPIVTININGFAIPNNQTLSHGFSIDSFVTTLTRMSSSLRVLSLVSLGMWGPLPDKIHRLSSLEVLDLSSNFLYGSIPPRMSTMVNLQTLALNSNCFNTTMPNWFGNSLSNLHSLSLNNNHFKGSFPSSLCKIKTLIDVSLSHNDLSGKLPDLSALTALHVLNLRRNRLESELPSMPKAVITILLGENLFSGKIPEQFGELAMLQHVDLSSNRLGGVPPISVFSLPNITYMNLASNVLSGSLPHQMACGTKLGYVDVSGNKLSGELPSCLASNLDTRVVKYGGNCLSVGPQDSQHQKKGSYCEEHSTKKFRALKFDVVIAAIVVGLCLILVVFAFGVFFRRKRCRLRKASKKDSLPAKSARDNSTTNGVSSEILANARLISQALKLGTQANPFCRMFSIEELKEATKYFDMSTYIGEGSIGKMYKGKLDNGSYVAIRSLALSKKCSIQNLKGRLDLLSKLHHPNLVSFLGHCIDDGGQDDSSILKLHLVYEYVPNGSYLDRLSEFSPEKALKWSDRLSILIGIAKAVHFLHTGVIPSCFNNQLKASNILLDEHNFPKLSDYGMSIIKEEVEKFEAKGEDPLLCLRTTLEDDVYNFGFILFESLVGTIGSEKREQVFLNEKASFGSQDGRRKIVDPIVLTTCSQESLSIAISITTKCISPEPSSRPSFEDVLWNLQYAAQVQATSDTDQKSD
ncbi:putative inactive leucine-rich repeat receptor-like protein kinase [Senna tora]|uniref:Putative inactive leucine-rich repeat receptor-like protein kinase n=1 Tax=Senna tora TaxID=362788 RepID=A0A834VXG7_9FABA|nr:putative inactive leucine-rich repeat receptor-like protein kinase [Senna tora]